MLQSINLNDKTYLELLEEAVSQIPLLGGEWTNFNVSDPGMTILQNFTSFQYLQRNAINTVTDAVKLKLLKLLGLEPSDAAEAVCLFEPEEPIDLPPYTKFRADNLVFETTRAEKTSPWGIASVYSEFDGVYTDVTTLLDRKLPAGAAVFGSPVRAGASFCCILRGKPDFSKKITLYARAVGDPRRNPFEKEDNPVFAELCWQLFTENGWEDLTARDGSNRLLSSGEISFEPTALQPAVCSETPEEGIAIRCVVKSHNYDFPPRLHSLTANLLRLRQRDTKAVMLRKSGRRTVTVNADAEVYPYIYVYAKESAKGPYREYRLSDSGEGNGRFYTAGRSRDGTVRFSFDRKVFGYAPMEGKRSVVIVCCTEEMARSRYLDKIYGYVDQELDINFMENIVDFCALVETQGADGQTEVEFVRPGELKDDFSYELNAREGKLIIKNPGWGSGGKLYAVSLAITAGAMGNVKEDNRFTSPGGQTLVNPARGTGGTDAVGAADLQRSFAEMMKGPESAVLTADYERIVQTTPGLCIHKVRATAEKGLITVAVKPHANEGRPALPPGYADTIRKRLNRRRMLTTAFRVVQPVYAAVDARVQVYVKSHFGNADESVEAALRSALDQVSGPAGFGETLRFSDVFQAIANLPCVQSLYTLTLTPRPGSGAVLEGLDVVPDGNCLCYPGELQLEIHTGSVV
ncbi:MAG: hypothetical protein FWG31_04640 [Oscillospiraceae bacterium]|nr:hypothetical protein [Oscillospiraceae bacterium]